MHAVLLDQPLTFRPIYQERVWGGRLLETRYGRTLPSASKFGESWELTDRDEALSQVASGSLAGVSLRTLWQDYRAEVFGAKALRSSVDRFPLLIKILDCCEDLSLQVHPPESCAADLGGEPKTEMWFVAGASPGAKLYVGLHEGVTREEFGEAIATGKVANYVREIEPKVGDFFYIPSGRLHAIGGGLLIFEIQQNSDTTFRVFDWNRLGLNGSPRDLHVDAALRSINFEDSEPGVGIMEGETLVDCEFFHVERWILDESKLRLAAPKGECSLINVVAGEIFCGEQKFGLGDFFMVPATGAEKSRLLRADGEGAEVLVTTLPS